LTVTDVVSVLNSHSLNFGKNGIFTIHFGWIVPNQVGGESGYGPDWSQEKQRWWSVPRILDRG